METRAEAAPELTGSSISFWNFKTMRSETRGTTTGQQERSFKHGSVSYGRFPRRKCSRKEHITGRAYEIV